MFMVTTDGAFAVAWISGMIVFLQTHTHTLIPHASEKAVQACRPCIRHTMHQTYICRHTHNAPDEFLH